MIDSAHCLANETLHIALGQVARNLAGTLAGGKSLGEELLRSLECVAVFGSLLVGDKVKVRLVLFLKCGALKSCAYLANEQVG